MRFESGGTIITGVAEVKNSSNKYVRGVQTDIRVEVEDVDDPAYMSAEGNWLVTSKDIEYALCKEGHDLMYHDRKDEWYCPFCNE